MKLFLLCILVIYNSLSYAQISNKLKENSIITIDFVKIKDNKYDEALYFYKNNWLVYRKIAKKKKFIKSYQLLKTKADSIANFDLILITEYKDSIDYKLKEERFQKIINKKNPNGPKFINVLKPIEFRIILFSKEAENIFDAK